MDRFREDETCALDADTASAVCSIHFSPDDYERRFISLPGLGKPCHPRLARDEIGIKSFPTIFKPVSEEISDRSHRQVKGSKGPNNYFEFVTSFFRICSLICLISVHEHRCNFSGFLEGHVFYFDFKLINFSKF